LQDLLRFTRIGIFGLKICHLATLCRTHESKSIPAAKLTMPNLRQQLALQEWPLSLFLSRQVVSELYPVNNWPFRQQLKAPTQACKFADLLFFF
jgi:hypothetical protein